MNPNTKNILLLIVRLIVGGLIAYHGYNKLIDMAPVLASFESKFGLGVGITWAVALGELLAGLGLIFGVWTKVAAVGAIIIMLGVFYYIKTYNQDAAIILVGSVIILIAGAGKYALCRCKYCKECYKDSTCEEKPKSN